MPQKHLLRSLPLLLVFLAPGVAFAQAPPREQTLAQAFDGQVRMIEREVLGLALKMPADKYNFAPATGTPPAGTFDGVRTFGLQVRHLATVMYQLSARILGEPNPIEMGTDENGSTSLRTKDEIVKYLQDSITYAHKAMLSITPQNQATTAAPAALMGLHTYDHYGQMVVYARLNGVTPGGAPAGAGQRGTPSR